MGIHGFIETSLLDWDGKICSVLFLPYCNFRCPYCDNGILLLEPKTLPEIRVQDVENFLRERKDFIDGVVISGGEPTIHLCLPEIIKRFKKLGLLVKLDTNGSNPDALVELLSHNLLNYIAMDIKAPLDERYHAAVGVKANLKALKQSIQIIMNSGIDYEFRTTVVPTLLDEKDIEAISREIAGAKKYALQQFVPDHTLDERLRVIAPYDKEKLLKMLDLAKKHVPAAIVRGV